MKIVGYYRGLPTDTALVSLMKALREVGNEVIPCFPLGAERPKGDASPGLAERMRNRVPVTVWNLGQMWADRRCAKILLDLCRSEKPDILHDRYVPFGLGAPRVARRLGIPLITIVHEFQAHQMPDKFSPLFRGLARSWEKEAIAGADRVIVVSHALRDALADIGIPPERIEVMPNGVHAELFEGLAEARLRRRAELGIAADEFVLGFLQGWEPFPLHAGPLAEKLLGELMGHLSDRRLRLVSVGGGTQLEAVRRRMGDDPRVGGRTLFAGQVPHDQVPGYLASFDVALIPAHESFTSPIKLFEYMAAGCAVVAPDSANLREIVRDGQTALLFPPGDVRAMAERIGRLMDNREELRHLGGAARREVLAKHTWRRNAERFTEIAEEVLRARGA